MTGKTNSHERMLEKLGAGGMGVVYNAEDTKLDRFLALKFLPDKMSMNHQAFERFQREACPPRRWGRGNPVFVSESRIFRIFRLTNPGTDASL